jgi:hypothetical protein
MFQLDISKDNMSKAVNIIILKITPGAYSEFIEFAYKKTFLFFEWWVRAETQREYPSTWTYGTEKFFTISEQFHDKSDLWTKVCQETFKKVLTNFKEKH